MPARLFLPVGPALPIPFPVCLIVTPPLLFPIGTLEVVCAGIPTLFGRPFLEQIVEDRDYKLRQCGIVDA